MGIDPAICRTILVMIEGDPGAGTGRALTVTVDGYGTDVIAHHVKYLWDEGLVEGMDVGHNQSPYPEILVTDITAAGRKHLDATEPGGPKRKIGF
jgi:Hypothetical protein (DUF2513)